jgi:D-glycero-beta-D-manno-heptose 1-phosphate adenylyltransferase
MNYLELAKLKILNDDFLNQMLAFWRFKQFKIVFTNGCFDILHLGHIDYLSKARSLGDLLIIGLNTDVSVSRIKGPERPVNDQNARSMLLASMTFVDAIVFFDDDTPYDLIEQIQPHVLVKGTDYKPDDIVGADLVKANGGRVVTIDFLEGYSTSSIIHKLRQTD